MLSAPFDPAPNARIASSLASGALPISLACATIAPAMPVPWTCGPSLLPSASKVSATELASSGCLASTPEFDHRNGDVHAAGELVGLRQPQLRDRILRGIALGRGLLLILQEIAEIELHRPHAAVGGEFTAHRLDRTPVDDPEQADGAAEQREILRRDALQAMTPRQFIGLGRGQRPVDFRDEFVRNGARLTAACELPFCPPRLALSWPSPLPPPPSTPPGYRSIRRPDRERRLATRIKVGENRATGRASTRTPIVARVASRDGIDRLRSGGPRFWIDPRRYVVLMEGTREPTLRLGVRMMLCA